RWFAVAWPSTFPVYHHGRSETSGTILTDSGEFDKKRSSQPVEFADSLVSLLVDYLCLLSELGWSPWNSL
ncbi:MAG TPA: hypothetical protein VFE24_05050, partial [Pirellulales bacterium]|nr:hypothetical protein [Pirellulales bacterium]